MTRNRTSAVTLAVLGSLTLATLASAAGTHDRHDGNVGYPLQLAVDRPPVQTGIASWYGGSRWQGNLTTSGERFDENRLTAAHASLPLGSQVRVTLVNASQSVVVTITDRPGTTRRVIDLSRAAAARLGILDRGLARVYLQPL